MDTVTHAIVALTLNALFRNAGWRPVAMAILASILPDADYYLFAADPLAQILHYGTYGHALLVTPLLAGLAMLPFGRPNHTARNYSMCLIAILLHLGIDVLGAHGVRVLLPVSTAPVHLDLIPSNDTFVIAILFLGLIAGIVFDAVILKSESSAARKGRRAWSVIALLCAGAYLTQRVPARENIIRRLSGIDVNYRGQAPIHIEVLPISYFGWHCVIIGETFVGELDIDLLIGSNGPRFVPRQNPSPALEAATLAPEIRALANFTEAPLWTYHRVNGATRVNLIDLRSGTILRPAYLASAIIAPDGTVAQSSFTTDGPRWHYEDGVIRRD